MMEGRFEKLEIQMKKSSVQYAFTVTALAAAAAQSSVTYSQREAEENIKRQ